MTFRGRRNRRALWWAAGAVIVVAAAVGLTLMRSDVDDKPPPLATVKRGDVTASVAAAGTVQPMATRDLAFAVAGTLKAVNVKPGDQVTAGQVLATLDSSDAAQAATEAQNSYNEAAQRLSEAEVAFAQCQDRSPAPSAPPVTQPCRDDVYSAQISVNNAKQALNTAKRNLAGTTITAPVAGKVLSVGGKPGDKTAANTFISLGVVATMLVKAAFAEADVAGLAIGQQAKIVLADRKEQSFTGTITGVDATATTSGQLVRYTVLVAFDQAPANLLIGQSATATVVFQRADGVLYLPQSAVNSSGEVRLPDGTTNTVGVGLRGDGLVQITSGLAEGSQVLLSWRG